MGGDMGDEPMGGAEGGSGEDEGEPRSSKAASRASPGGKDATALLKQDHQKVKRLFEEFARTRESAARLEVFNNIRNELTVHALIEEEIFYPELERNRKADLQEQVEEAHQEHDEAKRLLASAEGLSGDSGGLVEIVRTLREAVEHHVQEEEGEMFPRAREVFSGSQLKDLGGRLEARRRELVEQGMRALVEA
jgi:iron-sulfur cluster repair protein YtfE (RIC family)